jgi:hypothetical protein
VGSVSVLWNLFPSMKYCILPLYWSVGNITMELPLSAHAIVVLFFSSFDRIDFVVLVSPCVCLLCVRCSRSCSFSTLSATCFL